MEDGGKIFVIFNSELIYQKKKEIKKNIYSKHAGETKNKLTEILEKRAAEDSVRFQKRKLSRLFNPVFCSWILFSGFSGENKLDESALIYFADLFFEKLEKDFAVHIINYSLKGGGDSNFLEFEIFNYNFDRHKAIKSEFVRSQNVRKIEEIAGSIFKNSLNRENKKNKNTAKSAENTKKTENMVKKVEPQKTAVSTRQKPSLKPTLKSESNQSNQDSHIFKSQETNAEEFASGLSGEGEPEICEIFAEESKESIDKQVGKISLSWSLLSPAENIPVLENGEPSEIFQESLVRVYFQKPNVRQVVWRFRKKAEIGNSQPILRVYEGSDMLWYETLESLYGSRYIIFPEGLELSATWVEIGYLTDKGKFIFIARSPVWPPSCLSKKLPKINSKRKIPREVRFIGLGATESLSGVNQGGGFSSSGAGIK